MDILGQSALLVGMTSFALGVSVIARNVRNKLYLSFAVLTTVISAWALAFFFSKILPEYPFYRLHLFFNIWPTRFPWQPEFSQTRTAPSRWYVSNTGDAPVLEYSRVPLNGLRPGRLYWADRFSGEPRYDRRAFGEWIDSVWSWVRATAKRRAFAGHAAWCFPGAQLDAATLANLRE